MDPQIVKLTMLALYMGCLVLIGVLAARRMQGMSDYFAGGKKLGFWAASFSSRATGESAWLLLGLTGMGAVAGLKAFWVVFGETLGVAVAWLFMAGRFKQLTDRYDSLTIPDYLESRMADSAQILRKVAAAALVIFVTIYVSAQLDATGQAFEAFLGWNYLTGTLVGFAIVMAYITSGGFLAVVWSDVFQGTLMLVGLVVLPIAGIASLGGWDVMMSNLAGQDPGLVSLFGAEGLTVESVPEMLAFALIGLGFLGSPQIFARYLALNSTREIAPGTTVAVIWTLLADGGAVLSGMAGRALFVHGQNVEKVLGTAGKDVLPLMVDHLFPVMITGLYVAVVLSASMSTIDSLLVVAGSAAVRDYYQKIFHPEMKDHELMSISRNLTVLLAFVALAISVGVALLVPGRTIFWFVIFGFSGIAATFCPVMILSLYWRGLTVRGALASMITGFISIPVFKFLAPNLPKVGWFFNKLEELPPSFLMAFLAAIIFSKLDPGGPPDTARHLDELE